MASERSSSVQGTARVEGSASGSRGRFWSRTVPLVAAGVAALGIGGLASRPTTAELKAGFAPYHGVPARDVEVERLRRKFEPFTGTINHKPERFDTVEQYLRVSQREVDDNLPTDARTRDMLDAIERQESGLNPRVGLPVRVKDNATGAFRMETGRPNAWGARGRYQLKNWFEWRANPATRQTEASGEFREIFEKAHLAGHALTLDPAGKVPVRPVFEPLNPSKKGSADNPFVLTNLPDVYYHQGVKFTRGNETPEDLMAGALAALIKWDIARKHYAPDLAGDLNVPELASDRALNENAALAIYNSGMGEVRAALKSQLVNARTPADRLAAVRTYLANHPYVRAVRVRVPE